MHNANKNKKRNIGYDIVQKKQIIAYIKTQTQTWLGKINRISGRMAKECKGYLTSRRPKIMWENDPINYLQVSYEG